MRNARWVNLESGAIRAQIAPEIGGSLASLSWDGHALLRAAPLDCSDPRDTACFPLVPFANRIADGRIQIDGVWFQLANDGPAAPHALHGTGWTAPWQIATQSSGHAELRLDYAGPDWPWRFEARQRFRLTEHGIVIALGLTNRDSAAMPAGLGFHPYFERSAATRGAARLSHGWTPDFRGIATVPTPEAAVTRLSEIQVEALAGADFCCGGWSGEARIEQAGFDLRITASSTVSFLHFYVPRGASFFCAEPVSHAPDAANRNDVPKMARLEPGQTRTAWLSIEVQLGSKTGRTDR